MWKEKIKHGKEKVKKKERKEKEKNKTDTEGGERMGALVFLLSVGYKQDILKLTFNTINCLMTHNNLSCQFWGNLGL